MLELHKLLKMERYQLRHNRVYWCAAAGMLAMGFLLSNIYLPEIMGPDGGPAASLADLLNAMVYDSTMLLILVSSVFALLLGKEFSHRTINQEVSAGHSRLHIFTAKVITYLTAFNLVAIVYPVGGCIHEFFRFGMPDVGMFLWHFARAVLFSFLLNSAFFMIPVLFCFWLRSASRAVVATALTVFSISLYMAYGMLWKLPVGFLPIYQIREIVRGASFASVKSILVAFVWLAVLFYAGWRSFRNCELK